MRKQSAMSSFDWTTLVCGERPAKRVHFWPAPPPRDQPNSLQPAPRPPAEQRSGHEATWGRRTQRREAESGGQIPSHSGGRPPGLYTLDPAEEARRSAVLRHDPPCLYSTMTSPDRTLLRWSPSCVGTATDEVGPPGQMLQQKADGWSQSRAEGWRVGNRPRGRRRHARPSRHGNGTATEPTPTCPRSPAMVPWMMTKTCGVYEARTSKGGLWRRRSNHHALRCARQSQHPSAKTDTGKCGSDTHNNSNNKNDNKGTWMAPLCWIDFRGAMDSYSGAFS